MFKRFTVVMGALFLSLGMASLAQAQEADFGALFPSIVRVVGMSDESISLGSGVVIAKNDTGSYIITNYHVISNADASRIRIVAPKNPASGDDETIVSPARYVNGDSSTDIAVLYVPNFFAPPVSLAVGRTPENLAIRAIGYPGTDLRQWRTLKSTPSMTDGIVSTTETAPWRTGAPAVGQIQHTADLNEGMSGGPLLDLCGRVLAINTAYNSTANGVNLALSSADITPYLQRQNIAYTSTKTACDPHAKAAPVLPVAQKAPVDLRKVAADAKAKNDKQTLMTAGVIALVVALILAAVLAFLWFSRGGAPKAKTPSTPPHGLMFKGVGDAAGKSQIVRAEDLTGQIGFEIGRGPGFGSPGTSRRHARVLWSAAQGFVLRDLGSMSGTRVNGREIKGAADQPINLGDVVEFGAPDARYSVEKL